MCVLFIGRVITTEDCRIWVCNKFYHTSLHFFTDEYANFRFISQNAEKGILCIIMWYIEILFLKWKTNHSRHNLDHLIKFTCVFIYHHMHICSTFLTEYNSVVHCILYFSIVISNLKCVYMPMTSYYLGEAFKISIFFKICILCSSFNQTNYEAKACFKIGQFIGKTSPHKIHYYWNFIPLYLFRT